MERTILCSPNQPVSDGPFHLALGKQTYFTAIDGFHDAQNQDRSQSWRLTLMMASLGVMFGLLFADLLLALPAPEQRHTIIDVIRDAGEEISDSVPDHWKRPAVLVPAAFGLGYLSGSKKYGEKALHGAAEAIHNGKEALVGIADAAAEKAQDAMDYAAEHPIVAGAAATAIVIPTAIGVAKAIQEEDFENVPRLVKKGIEGGKP